MKNIIFPKSSNFSFAVRSGLMCFYRFMSLLVLSCGLIACGTDNAESVSSQPADLSKLYGHTWYLVSMDETRSGDMPIYKKFSLTIEKTKLSGNAFNSFFVSAKILSDGSMQVNQNLAATRMLAMGREDFLEKLYFSNILSAKKWGEVNGKLILSTEQGKLVFKQ